MNSEFHFATYAEIQAVMPWFIPFSSFLFGAVVGSFLNVCIHRMPRGHSVVHPRSRCYGCGKQIRWYDNIPLVSFLVLGAKCRDCKAPFSIRYWLVELLTAVTYVIIWKSFGPQEAIAYTIFLSGLIVATFIDFEHFIIPDEITIGGVVVGVICSGLVPSLQKESLHSLGAFWSLVGAGVGYGSLWAVVELGKRFFGVKHLTLPKETEVVLSKEGILIEGELDRWEDLFSRESDTLRFEGNNIRMGEKCWENARVEGTWKEIRIEGEVFPLEELKGELRATTQAIEIPREAMGFGDVKFIAAIGAFLGPKALFFVILVSSLTGSVVGLGTMLIGKREWGTKLPYGPYLAFAAVVWVFFGSGVIAWYYQWAGM